jgi:hypothetical protein
VVATGLILSILPITAIVGGYYLLALMIFT